jgi:hypothetical protein
MLISTAKKREKKKKKKKKKCTGMAMHNLVVMMADNL